MGVGIDNSLTDQIMIYPNPAIDRVTIETNGTAEYNLAIISINGQVIFRSRIDEPKREIDISAFPEGIYFITIRSNDVFASWKIVKLK
jgi:hypothetical protein